MGFNLVFKGLRSPPAVTIFRETSYGLQVPPPGITQKSNGLPQQAEVPQGVPGRSSAKRTGHLYPRRYPRYSLSEAESTSGHMVLSGEPRKKSPLTPPGIDPGTVRLVAQCLNQYATPGPTLLSTKTC